jgi:hypothetical protein
VLLLSRFQGRCRDVEAAFEVLRPAHVFLLLLKAADEAEVKAAVEAKIFVGLNGCNCIGFWWLMLFLLFL